MNRKTLQKVIDELSKPTPRLDYVRGVLETIIETLPENEKRIVLTRDEESFQILKHGFTANSDKPKDEASILNATAAAKLAEVKRLAQASQ